MISNTRLLLLFTLGLAGCGLNRTSPSRVDRDLSAFILPDAILLAGVEMAQLRATPVYQKLETRRSLPQLDEFTARTGFDPRRDVRTLLISSDATETVVAARGDFKVTIPESMEKLQHGKHTIYKGSDGAFAILDDHTTLAGSLNGVRRAIDQSGKGPVSSGLVARAREVPAGNQIWAVTLGGGDILPRAIPRDGNAANLSRFLRSLEQISFWADLRSGAQATAIGVATTDKDAETIASTIRGFVGLGRLRTSENRPELLRFIDSIAVRQEQRTVRLTIDVPRDVVDQLLQ
jgi:hypothetical protein